MLGLGLQFKALILSGSVQTFSFLSSIPEGSSFMRSSSALLLDFESLYKDMLNNEPRFEGVRRVYNLIRVSTIADVGGTTTKVFGITDPLGGNNAIKVTADNAGVSFQLSFTQSDGASRDYTISTWIKANTVTGNIWFDNRVVIQPINSAALDGEWYRIALEDFVGVNGSNVMAITFENAGDSIDLAFPQFEEVTNQTVTAPSEYVVGEETHGAYLEGLQYFDYQNGNTVNANGIVTEAQGSPIATAKGLLLEKSASNRFKNSDAPATQTLSVNAAPFTFSMKGAGSFNITPNTAVGTGFGICTEGNDIHLDISSGGLVDCTLTGDATLAQMERRFFSTSFIITAGASVTRAADILTIPSSQLTSDKVDISITLTPIMDGNQADGDESFFNTVDSRGASNEVGAILFGSAYGFVMRAEGGGLYTFSLDDIVKGVETTYQFKATQEAPNVVRAIILKDDIEKYNNTHAGTLDHSNQGMIEVGSRNGSDSFSAHYKQLVVR